MSFFIRTDANAENRVMNGTECDVAKMPSARAKFSSWWNWIWQLYHVWNPRERTKRYKLCCWKFLVHAFYLWVKGYIKKQTKCIIHNSLSIHFLMWFIFLLSDGRCEKKNGMYETLKIWETNIRYRLSQQKKLVDKPKLVSLND